MTRDRTDLHYALRSIRFERASSRPVFKQLVEHIRRKVQTGELGPGEMLPSIRRFSAAYGIGRNTVAAAYEQLAAEGVCETRRGSGTVVSPDAKALLSRAHASTPRQKTASFAFQPSMRAQNMSAVFTPNSQDNDAMRPGVPDVRMFPRTEWAYALSRACRFSSSAYLINDDHLGFRPLREALARHLRNRRGVHCEPDQICIVNSAHAAYQAIATSFADIGDAVLTETPGYVSAVNIFQCTGQTIATAPVDDDGADLSAPQCDPAKLILLTPAAQVPLGVSMSLARRQAALQFARDHGAMIIEADYGAEFEYADKPLPTLFELDEDARVFTVGSFSTTMFSTLRVAYIVAPKAAIAGLRPYLARTKAAPSYIIQAALADFFKRGNYDSYIRRSRQAYKQRLRHFLSEAKARLPAWVRIPTVNAGLVISFIFARPYDDFAIARQADAAGLPIWPLSECALDGNSVSGLTTGFASVDEAGITDNLTRLAEILKDYAATR